MSFKTKLLSVFCLVIAGLVSATQVFAQQFPSLGSVAVNVEVADADASAGDIISIEADGLRKSKVAYDDHAYGVVIAAPVISISPKSDKTKSLVSEGQADVKVSAATDAIKVGDYITTSDKAGVGQKATKAGYAIGKALANYDDKSKDGVVPVSLSFGFAAAGQITGLGGGIASSIGLNTLLGGKVDLRYILAAAVGIVVFLASAFAFIRFVSTGLEAIGRNPLAKSTILVGMIISGSVVAVLSVAGFGVVFAIIKFVK